MSWQKSLTNLFHTWRAEASSLTQRRLLTRPQDTHTTHRYEVGLSRSVFQGVISLTSQLLGIMEFDWWRSSRPLAPWMTLYTVSLGHSEMPRHFCYSFCFLPVFSGTTAWSMKHTSVTFFLLSKQNKTKKNLGSWLFLFWGSELRREEENDVCGFNSCLSVVVSVYLDGYFLLWPLTLLHIGVLCAFRWSFLILFLVAFSTSETCSCGTFAHHLS